jgi:hypothetical protein
MVPRASHCFVTLAMNADGQHHYSIPDIDVKCQSSKSGIAQTSDGDKVLADPAA